jgi:hypothetical protein
LKKAIAYLIANADLPFLFVEHKSFRDLMFLLNAQVQPGNLLFSQKIIAMEDHYLHKSHSQIIKKMFEKIKHIGFTLDAWTSLNTIAFLGITVHAITAKWELIDIVVAMPQVHGQSMLSKFMVSFFLITHYHPHLFRCSHQCQLWKCLY